MFFGGVNVYLQQKSALFRRLPGFVDRFFDQPWLLRWAASRSLKTSARELGELTVSVLRGQAGRQHKEVRRLCRWLASSVRPQLVNLTNMLIAGCAVEIRDAVRAPILATLQGDDLFLEQLPEPYRSQALAEIRRLVRHVDGFLVFSRYYADFMAEYFQIPRERFEITPLGVETGDFADPTAAKGPAPPPRPPRIGYLARLAPEKGLHLLVEAFLELRRRPATKHAQLHIAGYLAASDRDYAESLFARLRAAGAGDDFQYVGEVDRRGKIEFLRQIDVFSAPTICREPKGLFVLEALAAGVPVVQPDHGAFPELLEAVSRRPTRSPQRRSAPGGLARRTAVGRGDPAPAWRARSENRSRALPRGRDGPRYARRLPTLHRPRRRLNGPGYFGAMVQIMRRPCCCGGASNLPNSSNTSSTVSITLRPSSTWAISRPRKTTDNCTLSLCWRKVLACFTLKLMSCSPVFGRRRISLILVW